ncbi:Cof-type HAD-IIB family hydrolase [Haloimpatiens sp. FM7330]|uniref:Cof-type HAD-IIB family hydrolase n=1 Tax=Haloimpatiens sp. FM7330 TaxID=3298610 RepID=UPI003634B614
MFKLLALDMDGTVLNNKKQISEENKIAIKKAQEKGVTVALCTGRSIGGIQKYLEELDLIGDNNYSITVSGSCILNNTRKNIIKNDTLNNEDINYVNNVAKELDLTLNGYASDRLYVPSANFFSYIDSIANDLPMEIVDFKTIGNDFVNKITLINEDISLKKEFKKIENFFPDLIIPEVEVPSKENFNKDLFNAMSNLPSKLTQNYTILKTSPYTIEILNKHSNKGTGVQALAEKLGIKREEVICIGDSGNDEHMIEYAGLGVAMGNAFPEIKEIADYITLTNEEHGVAHVIDKFILN